MLWECVQGGKPAEAVTDGGARMRVWRYPAQGAECVGQNVWVQTLGDLRSFKAISNQSRRLEIPGSQVIIQGVESRLYSTLKVYNSHLKIVIDTLSHFESDTRQLAQSLNFFDVIS